MILHILLKPPSTTAPPHAQWDREREDSDNTHFHLEKGGTQSILDLGKFEISSRQII